MTDAKHEAPAEDEMADPDCRGCGGGDKVPAGSDYWRCPVCDAEWNGADEAPAEGAGEREEIARTLWISRGGINRLFDEGSEWKNGNGFEHRQQCFVDADAILALRACSFAPEAREGEAWGWAYRQAEFGGVVMTPKPEWRLWVMATDVDRRCIEDMRSQGSRYDLQSLYTHPAAPSADKLRIAVEALERVGSIQSGWNKPHRIGTARQMVDDCEAIARNTLAALKAEGA